LDEAFKRLHSQTDKAFTRVLTFNLVLAIILRKGVKSLQNSVSEALLSWLGAGTASV